VRAIDDAELPGSPQTAPLRKLLGF